MKWLRMQQRPSLSVGRNTTSIRSGPVGTRYEKAAGQMTAAIAAATDAKGPIKDHIRRELVKKGKVASEDQIDFQIVGSGGRLKINKLLTAKKTRVKGENLF